MQCVTRWASLLKGSETSPLGLGASEQAETDGIVA